MKRGNGSIVFLEAGECYKETKQAQPSGRLLDRSSDYGFTTEYVGYGYVGDIAVKAIYLFDAEDLAVEDECDLDWERGLRQGRYELKHGDIN